MNKRIKKKVMKQLYPVFGSVQIYLIAYNTGWHWLTFCESKARKVKKLDDQCWHDSHITNNQLRMNRMTKYGYYKKFR